MKKTTALLFAFTSLALAACEEVAAPANVDAVTTRASTVTPSAAGTFAEDLIDPQGEQYSVASGNGYAYQVGINATQTGLVARAGLLPGTAVTTPAPAVGSSSMEAIYHLRTISNASIVDGELISTSVFKAGEITLVADFSNETLTGSSGALTINGIFDTGVLSGTASYGTINGTLSGVVGADQAVGAFQGSNTDSVMAGGFQVSE
jgi:hypothetical protein